MPNSITGTYKTKRDGGLLYSYEARGTFTEQGVRWDSKVRREGDLAGTPNGEIYDTHGIEVDIFVKASLSNP